MKNFKIANIHRNAFTLAEVLITLAIIGIVAALTIPTLVQNYQKKQWVTGLQKGYATLNNVFKLAIADDGVDKITQTSLWNSIPADESGGRDTISSNIDYSGFVSNLQKYMKINKFCNPTENKNECFNIEYKILDGSNDDGLLFKSERLKIYAADGIVYYFRLRDDFVDELMTNAGIEIDVNGDNPPNQFGRDLFNVRVTLDGSVRFSTATAEDLEYRCSIAESSQYPSHYDADYCGTRVFENGWKMDY